MAQMKRTLIAGGIVWMFVTLSVSALRAADAEKGNAVFERCAACHQLSPDKSDDAPTLAGVFGRKIASIPEFRYSAAMKRSTIVWDAETLDAFVKDPQAFVPGTRMPFDGVADKSDRDDLLEYLKQATSPSGR